MEDLILGFGRASLTEGKKEQQVINRERQVLQKAAGKQGKGKGWSLGEDVRDKVISSQTEREWECRARLHSQTGQGKRPLNLALKKNLCFQKYVVEGKGEPLALHSKVDEALFGFEEQNLLTLARLKY